MAAERAVVRSLAEFAKELFAGRVVEGESAGLLHFHVELGRWPRYLSLIGEQWIVIEVGMSRRWELNYDEQGIEEARRILREAHAGKYQWFGVLRRRNRKNVGGAP